MDINTGDIIEFSSPEVPLPFVQAVVIEVTTEHVEVMSTLLVPFQHSGIFPHARINVRGITCPAKEAIPREVGAEQGEVVECILGTGVAIAGFDGILVARREDGKLITGGRSHFKTIAEKVGTPDLKGE